MWVSGRTFTRRCGRRASRVPSRSPVASGIEAGRFDAQGDLGHRLPLAVISDLLDIPEADRPTFGAGMHFCLGATLARVELEEAIRVLAQPGRTLALEAEPRWVPLAQIRCFEPPVWVRVVDRAIPG